MKETITLTSRDKTSTYLRQLKRPDGTPTNTYMLKTSGLTLRVGKDSLGRDFIDPSGGPMLIKGCKVAEADAVIKSIDFTEGLGYTITFEE